jgi:hypothetical protein
MRALTVVLTLLTGVFIALAHPGVGIVMDRRGNVYYTDLKQVWQISPSGSKRVVVPNVHTHELHIDSLGNLYGEHLRYEGEATNRWWHRVWKLSPDGKLRDFIPERQGFLDDYNDFHFVHDGRNNFYWAARGDTTVIRRRGSDGKVVSIASARFQDVRWMTASHDGTVYLVDLYELVRVTPDGVVKTLATGLADWNLARLLGPDRHAVMGIWTDAEGNAYTAVTSGGVVKRISTDGKVKVVARSYAPWFPTGGFVAPNGDLWVLEYTMLGAVRVSRIQTDGKRIVYR